MSTTRLDELVETQDPVNGARGGLLDFHTWLEAIAGWIVWLGSLGAAVFVVDKLMSLVTGGAGILGTAGGFLGRLLGKAPAPAATSTTAAPSTQANGNVF